ncbi:GntR family transcriptional regulator [Cupriavidus sp. 2MCAB6]
MMNRVTGHLAVLVVLGLSAFDGAQASDINCKSAPGAGSVRCEDPHGNGTRCTQVTDNRPRNRHLVCDDPQLSMRYERIYAEQQRLLRTGVTNDADVGAWRIERDACGSVRCLDNLFHQWWRWRDAARIKPASRSVPPGTTVAAPVPPKQEPAPAAEDRATPAQLIAMQESPQPIGPTPPTAASFQASPTSIASGQAMPKPAGTVGLPGLLTGFAAFGIGAACLWKRKRDRRASPQHEQPWTLSTSMAIVYGLLIVNALLLAFTLGLS